MEKKRPVHLALQTMKFPMMAVVSILHRLSGVVLFVAIPFLLWMLQGSLASFTQYANLQHYLTSFPAKLSLFIVVSALIYHLVAGIRHLLMDIGVGESLCAGRWSAWLTLAVSLLLVVWLGVRIW